MSILNRYISRLEAEAGPDAQQSVRYRVLHHTSMLSLLVNVTLVLGKAAVGLTIHSVAVIGDAVNNLSDCVSSVVSLLASRFAGKPADDKHPFGHARLEYLASTFIAALVFFIGLELGKQSVERIIHPRLVKVSPVLVIVMVASVLLKLLLYCLNRGLGSHFDSDMMRAVASDSIADVLATSSVLLGLVVGHLTDLKTDGWFGLVVSLFIIYSGFDILKDTISRLLGERPDPHLTEKIFDLVNCRPGVLGSHDLILHDYGPDRYFATIDVEVDAAAPLLVSHDLVDELEREVKHLTGVQLVVHLDPVDLSDPMLPKLRALVAEIVQKIPGFIDFHDFRVSRKGGVCHVMFDIVVEPSVTIADSEIHRQIEEALKRACPEDPLAVFLTVDRSYNFNYVENGSA